MADDLNPYASPSAPSIVTSIGPHSDELRVASQGKRFLNMLLDQIVIQVLLAAVGFVVGLVLVVLAESTNVWLWPEDEIGAQFASFIIALSVNFAYYVVMETLFQKTVAKYLTGTRVVTKGGNRPSFGQVLGRSLVRFIPFEAFSFLGNGKPIGWHDSLSDTRVISTR